MTGLFLGVGNLQRADDGVGPYMAQRLIDDGRLAKAGIEVLPHSGEGASLMHLWEGQKKVIIVDCMKTGIPLGSVRRFDVVAETLHSGVFRYSSHLFGLAEATELSRQLGSLPEAMVIFGVEGKEFAFGEPFSPAVGASMDQVFEAVLAEFGITGS